MKSQLLTIILAASTVCTFAETPTPPRPADDAKVIEKRDENADLHASKSYKNAREVAILLNEFAGDSGGKLPQKLEELVPAYAADKAMLAGLELKTPGAELAKLAHDTVVMSHAKNPRIVIKASQLQGIKKVAP